MTDQTQEAIEEINININAAKKFVARGKSLQRLLKNRDFKDLINEGYFKDEAVRLVHLRSNPDFADDASRKMIETSMDGIASLLQYCRTVEHNAMLAEKAIEADEQARDELMGEDVE
ncbi:hypothetical protein [Vreelandella venusta]|uniref:hypothetical protein n=1 Tax=Vreelandella venusta TaxID=44935 RepID=UPI00116B2B78|nr:hypothetical protein [Halomonas venusta]GEK52354.1 hypothetical protein HVE01_30750 [Halomonas venusta]